MKLCDVVEGIEGEGKLQVALLKAIDRFGCGEMGVETDVDLEVVLGVLLKELPAWEKHQAALMSQLTKWWDAAQVLVLEDVELDLSDEDDLNLDDVESESVEVIGTGKALKSGQWDVVLTELGMLFDFASTPLADVLGRVLHDNSEALGPKLEHMATLPYDSVVYKKRHGYGEIPANAMQLDHLGLYDSLVVIRDELLATEAVGDLGFLRDYTACVAVTVNQIKVDSSVSCAKALKKISTKLNNDVRALCRQLGIGLADIGSGFYCVLGEDVVEFKSAVNDKYSAAVDEAVRVLVDDEFATIQTASEQVAEIVNTMSVSFEWAPMAMTDTGSTTLDDFYADRAVAFDRLVKARSVDVLTAIIDRMGEL